MKKLIIIALLLFLNTYASASAYNLKQINQDITLLQQQLKIEKKRHQVLSNILELSEQHAKKFIRYNKKLDYNVALRYGLYIEKYARKRNLKSNLIVAIIITESHANYRAKSYVGAIGLMQIYYKVWKKEINLSQEQLYSPETNIRYGTKILKYYIDRYNGNIVDAVCAYNTGSKKKLNPNYTNKVLNMYFKMEVGMK